MARTGCESPLTMLRDRIQCVLVIYRVAIHESESFQTLSAALLANKDLAVRTSLLVYDNSPEATPLELPAELCAELRYQHNATNGGLAIAYNSALRLAEETGCTWLWLFDQDTTIVPGLLAAVYAAIDGRTAPDVNAIVPRLVQDGVLLSPVAVRRFRYQRLPMKVMGTQSVEVTALNSCACLRVSALQAIQGFPQRYWLDFLDHAVFHRLQKRGGKTLVLDISISHRLSTNNLRKESSPRRYGNVLDAEWQFVLETGWGGGRLFHRLRLLKRAARTLLVLREPAFALQVLQSSLRGARAKHPLQN